MGIRRGEGFFAFEPGKRRFSIAGRRFKLPRSRLARIGLGSALMLGGVFAFLPVLGVWMLPLGLLVLSQDIPLVRRWRRRAMIHLSRRRRKADPEH